MSLSHSLIMSICMCCTVASLTLAQSAGAQDGKLAADQRDKKEQRLVEILRVGLATKGPPTAEAQAMLKELKGLLFELAGVDPNNPPPNAGAKLAEVQGEILKRRDPALAEQLLLETKRYACRSKQTEASAELKAIVRSQNQWRSEHEGFATDIKSLDVDSILTKKNYDWQFVSATAKAYKVRAIGKGDMAGDEWEVTENGTPVNTKNLCDSFQKPADR